MSVGAQDGLTQGAAGPGAALGSLGGARSSLCPGLDFEDQLRIEPGTLDDYKMLNRFHYKGARPGGVTSVIRMTRRGRSVVGRYLGRDEQTQIVGVLVRSLPHLSCRMRDVATGNRYNGLAKRDAAVMLNREVRTISRVVIDPQWRGLGLAVKLVRWALEHPEDRRDDPPAEPGAKGDEGGRILFTEALAAMGRVSPFFEHAGMTRYERPVLRGRAGHARLIDAMEHLGMRPAMLASRQIIDARLDCCDAAQRRWLERELRQWHRSAHRTSKAELQAMSFDELLRTARDELMAEPVYYVYPHQQQGDSAAPASPRK